MYPPTIRNDAAAVGQRPSDEGRAPRTANGAVGGAAKRASFRPVALPALAAAVHIAKAAEKASRAKLATRPRIVHEDEPVL